MRQLSRKGHSRMYLLDVDDTEKVLGLMKELDEFELSYIPDGWIAPWERYPETVYTGKFDEFDMDHLVGELWRQGVKCWVFDSQHEVGLAPSPMV